MEGKEPTPDTVRSGVRRWFIRESAGTVIVAAALFVSAGRLDWWAGWALVAIYALWVAANAILLVPRCPELLAERAGKHADTKKWDLVIMSGVGVATFGSYVVAGLDVRWGWTTGVPLWAQVPALCAVAAGYGVTTWAMTVNAFFSLTVRIQDDRGQKVATSGPYRVVRHPGYTGTVAFSLGAPVLLGSWWALGCGAAGAVLMVVRTALEDRTLRAELKGYSEFAEKVRYRLVPGIW